MKGRLSSDLRAQRSHSSLALPWCLPHFLRIRIRRGTDRQTRQPNVPSYSSHSFLLWWDGLDGWYTYCTSSTVRSMGWDRCRTMLSRRVREEEGGGGGFGSKRERIFHPLHGWKEREREAHQHHTMRGKQAELLLPPVPLQCGWIQIGRASGSGATTSNSLLLLFSYSFCFLPLPFPFAFAMLCFACPILRLPLPPFLVGTRASAKQREKGIEPAAAAAHMMLLDHRQHGRRQQPDPPSAPPPAPKEERGERERESEKEEADREARRDAAHGTFAA